MITVACSSCGATTRRLRPQTTAVLCMNCCSPPEHELREQVLKDTRRRLELQLRAFDATGSYDDALLDMSATTTAWQRKSVAAITEHQGRIARGEPGRTGILFTGPTGIGKTHAAIAVCRRAMHFDPTGVRIVTESSLLQPGIPPWELHAHICRTLDGVRTLLVDDVGTVARPQDQVMSAWKLIADRIVASPDPVLFIATTNLPDLARLSDWVGAQATSRIAAFVQVATTGWTDHRAGLEHPEWKANFHPRPAVR
ncbi:ATP-binding protein [Gordonia alkanivorans]|uniref:ATP-binding protein n=1 Tax=Gordonia alkanivorans TaxID=84096 RepID=UPI0018CBFE10|nr:ATP-binding protein [Gordonia alkanivorans]